MPRVSRSWKRRSSPPYHKKRAARRNGTVHTGFCVDVAHGEETTPRLLHRGGERLDGGGPRLRPTARPNVQHPRPRHALRAQDGDDQQSSVPPPPGVRAGVPRRCVRGLRASRPSGTALSFMVRLSCAVPPSRYPQALSTASPSEWLHGHFKVARDALRGRPCRTQIQSDCVDSPFVVSFKAIVVIDRPPCTQENNRMNSRTSPYAGKIPIMWQCTAQDNLVWAETVLRRYVAAVDRAVGQVSPSVRRRAFISPLIPWCYCSG